MKNNHAPIPAERHQRILEILREEFTIRISSLSESLGVSEMTIRRDLDTLEARGMVERTHGGAVFRQERVAGKFHYRTSIEANPKEKESIARKAAALIEPHDSIYIGEGTTAAWIARYVEPGMPFTIFTNNLGVIAEIQDNSAELILLTGSYNAETYSLAGPLTMEMIRQINATKVFFGADGLSISAGLTTSNIEIAVIERAMIQQTRGKVIVMADYTKFGMVAEMTVSPLKQIDVLITNRKVSDDFQQDLEQMGVQVVIA